nr:leucine rich repeat containing protein 47 [Hymenolepis microstoma]
MARITTWPEVDSSRKENRRELVVSNRDTFDPSVYTLTQLNFLDISRCPLHEITDDLSNLTALSKLSLQHDEIIAVSLGLGQLRNLKFLDLSFNSISNLPSNIFDNLSLLETLILDSNKLSELPSLEGLIELHIFSVSNNQLLSLPGTLTCCTKLKSVDVSGNNIEEISNEVPWFSLSNIQHFYLNGNQLKDVPSGLTECKRLRDLQLKENPLKDARLRKLAASDRDDAGNALMNYLLKTSNRKKKLAKTSSNNGIASQNDILSAPNSALIENLKILSMIESDDSDFRIDVIQPEEVKKGLRPRIFGCVISGVSLNSEGLIRTFTKFQAKLHAKLSDNRKLATFSTHAFEAVKMPLKFSLQPIDDICVSGPSFFNYFVMLYSCYNGIIYLSKYKHKAYMISLHLLITVRFQGSFICFMIIINKVI